MNVIRLRVFNGIRPLLFSGNKSLLHFIIENIWLIRSDTCLVEVTIWIVFRINLLGIGNKSWGKVWQSLGIVLRIVLIRHVCSLLKPLWVSLFRVFCFGIWLRLSWSFYKNNLKLILETYSHSLFNKFTFEI
jgi:hypothetical protein